MSAPFDIPLETLRTRTSVKWHEFEPDVLPLWVAEMDLLPAPAVVDAVTAALAAGDTGYPHGTAYADAYAAFASRRWGWHDVDPRRIAPVADVMQGIFEAIMLVARRPVDGSAPTVIVSSPVYPPFYGYAEHAGARVVESRLGDDLRLDLDAIDDAFSEVAGHGVYLLCNPQNPTGVVHTAAELARLALLAEKHDVRVVADEIHAPLVHGDVPFTPYLSLPEASRGIAVFSASKAFNLAGMRTALIVFGPDAAADLERLPEIVSHGASHLAAIAHTAALNDGDAWLDELLAGLRSNRDALGRLLAEHAPSISWRAPDATFLAWLDCSSTAIADPDSVADPGLVTLSTGPAAAFAERARVALNAGEAFGTGGENHVRLNFATSPEILEEAVRRMGSIL